MQAEIPGQDHDGYDAEPNFYGMHQVSGPRFQQRAGRLGHLKRLRLAMTRRFQSVPTPAPAPPATSPPVATTTTFKTYLRRIFTLPLHHATPPVVDVPFAQGRQRNAAAGAPGRSQYATATSTSSSSGRHRRTWRRLVLLLLLLLLLLEALVNVHGYLSFIVHLVMISTLA
ncbi:uncharacterized protein F5147DRAFT_760873 [Suillus discolor]|uniref:Uncharacterized protein n=1 Tax=Suillus discolor TaxID=1912936 RepID=A0A9P7F740_9AGAM|nr:uncharacterized protein F5147DRAFT_760873 [Suillus discolor]KAG2108627.1 hypothetical protein F5147DRAFT_760873 [Suillus discolor]